MEVAGVSARTHAYLLENDKLNVALFLLCQYVQWKLNVSMFHCNKEIVIGQIVPLCCQFFF
jgi:hypothetical protein